MMESTPGSWCIVSTLIHPSDTSSSKKIDHGYEKDIIFVAEVDRLMKAGHIHEVQYSDWICNVVLVEKSLGK